jgi:hypothetical protein
MDTREKSCTHEEFRDSDSSGVFERNTGLLCTINYIAEDTNREKKPRKTISLGLHTATAEFLIIFLVFASAPQFCFTFAPTSLVKFSRALLPAVTRYPARTRPVRCMPSMSSQDNALAEEQQKSEGIKKKNLQIADLEEVKAVIDQVLLVSLNECHVYVHVLAQTSVFWHERAYLRQKRPHFSAFMRMLCALLTTGCCIYVCMHVCTYVFMCICVSKHPCVF